MRICTGCQQELPLKDFYSKGNRPYAMCKSCFNAYCVQRWINRKEQVIEQMGNRCADCQQSYPYPVYEFHHLDPARKEFDWTRLRLRSQFEIDKELSGCVLLCANCHRMRHANERQAALAVK